MFDTKYVNLFIATICFMSSDWLKIRSGCGILISSAAKGLRVKALDKVGFFFQPKMLMCFHENILCLHFRSAL